MQTDATQIKRNRVQIQLAPSPNASATLPHLKSVPSLPDKLRPNYSIADAPLLHIQRRSAASLSPMRAAFPSALTP